MTNVLFRQNIWKQNNLYRNICKHTQKDSNGKTYLPNRRLIYCPMGRNVKTLSQSSIWWKNFLRSHLVIKGVLNDISIIRNTT